MKKPLNYYGMAFDEPGSGYNKKFLESKEGKKEIKKTKKRQKSLRKELKKNGFDRSETWGLDYTIARFVLPRLKYFSENLHGYPGNLTEKKWNKILKKMIYAFENMLDDEILDKDYKRIQKGFNLFGKYFQSLGYKSHKSGLQQTELYSSFFQHHDFLKHKFYSRIKNK